MDYFECATSTTALSGQIVAFNRQNNSSDKVENFFKKIYSLMDVSIDLNM